tara:strand:- start:4331 stop:4918 length:588 start_codon:yes stop_codon:yes gene_type:complete
MSIVATPSGAEPVGTLSASGSYTGKLRHMAILSTYNTNIFTGDFVLIASDGTCRKAAITTAIVAGTIGIFMGCAYTDPTTQQMTFSAMWPANNAATDAVAYVVDDPFVLFRMQADGAMAQTDIGNNAKVIATGGESTVMGRSKNAIDADTDTTNTFPLRVVEFVDGPDSTLGDAYQDVICMFAPTSHAYLTLLGV